MDTKKPNIARLFEAIQEFILTTSRAGYSKQKWSEARTTFHERLDTLGIADVFDWDEQ